MEKEMEKTIYGEIVDAMENGRLPEGFAISYNDPYFKSEQLRMAPGAIDGMTIYHVRHEDLTEMDDNEIIDAIMAASSGNPQAYAMFSGLGRRLRAIDIIDELQQHVRKHADELDAAQLYKFSVLELILEGRDIECVKFGLELLELFGEPNDQVKQIVRNLGLYSEFTIFSVFNMLLWENGNEEIFNLAKNVEGWGRVHAIERLKPESQEIKDWLLYEGGYDSTLSSYTALTCMINSGAAERLKNRTTDKEYTAIGDLIGYLLQGEPGDGISELPEAESVLADYVAQAGLHNLDIYGYKVILDIFYYVSEEMNFPDLTDLCRQVLTGDDCRKCIKEAVKTGQGIDLAIACGIPYKEALLQALKNDFENQYSRCRYLLNDKEYRERTLDIFRKHIPPQDIEQNPQDELGLGPEFTKYMQLDFLLQELGDKPFCGIDYVSRTIASPVTRNRTMSMRILKSWVNIYRIPLKVLLPQIYDRLLEIRSREVNDGVSASMQQLIDGVTDFPEDERTARNHLDCFEDNRFSDKAWSAPVLVSPIKVKLRLSSYGLENRNIADIKLIGCCYCLDFCGLGVYDLEKKLLKSTDASGGTCKEIDYDAPMPMLVEIDEPMLIKFTDGDVLELITVTDGEHRVSMNCIPWEIRFGVNHPSVDAAKLFKDCLGRTITSVEFHTAKYSERDDTYSVLETEYEGEDYVTDFILRFDDGNGMKFYGCGDFGYVAYVDSDNCVIKKPFNEIAPALFHLKYYLDDLKNKRFKGNE